MPFTVEQELARDTHGANLMVSAGAGSGKTAVLTERIYKMLDAGMDITRLLVLTFTNAAALEMKTRIKKAIVDSGKLKEQAEKVDNAFITTFDAFALSLVKKYHHLIGVSKNVTIVEEVVMKLKKLEIIDDIFAGYYAAEDNQFYDLLNKFTFKNDKAIKESIYKIATKLEKKPYKNDFLNSYLENYYSEESINNFISIYIKECNERLIDVSYHAKELYNNAVGTKLGDSLNELMLFASVNHSYDDLVSFFTTTFKLKNAPKDDEELKELRKKFKEDVIDKYKNEFLRYKDEFSIKQSVLDTEKYVSLIIDILLVYFKRVDSYKRSVNLFEFDDISMMILELLDNNPEVLNEIRLSFDEILLDEYQDTSDIQEALISKISNNNVYMVGDIKQSIYRFRNANPYIFKEKYNKYTSFKKGDAVDLGGIKIDLIKNFRSRKEVLNNINLMFKYLMTDECGDANYTKEHQMVYGNEIYDAHKMSDFSYDQEYLTYEPDESCLYTNSEIETFIVANKIKQLMTSGIKVYDKDLKCFRNIEYKDIAIIIPRKKQVSLIEKIFTNEGIPLRVEVADKITESIILKLMNSLFNLVINISNTNSDDYKFYFLSVARSFLFEMSDNDILKESFNKYLDNVIYQKALNVYNFMYNNSVSKTFEFLLKEFNVYESLIKIGDINNHLLVINYVANLLTNLADYGYDFNRIAKHFEVIIDDEIEVDYTKNIGANGVILINIHKSKGLEYPICFFMDLTSKFNRVDIKDSFLFDNNFGFITPYFQNSEDFTFLKILYKNNYLKEDVSERIRLFYVALTRAREKMYFVIPKCEYLEKVSSPFKFSSYSHFISHYYDYTVAPYVNEIKYEDFVNKKYLDFTAIDYKKKIIPTSPISYSSKVYESNVSEKVRISKSTNELLSKDEIDKLNIGTRIHEILQTIDLVSKDMSGLSISTNEFNLLSRVLSLPCFDGVKDAKVYKEYEFIYEKDGKTYHGIIDLLVEYDDHFEIIDYKLSDIDKEEYVKQLNEYYKYIKSISNKDVKMYLLSVTKCKLKEVFVVE